MADIVDLDVQGIDIEVYRRFEEKVSKKGIRMCDAMTQAMELWIRETGGCKDSKPDDIVKGWGTGTEKTSTEIDELLYGWKKKRGREG